MAAESHEFPGIEATFVHPFDNHDFIAGHGTMGLEIVEDCPDVRTVICAIGGGGLITGVGSAIKAKRPDAKVVGAEPETAAPYALSLREGGPQKFGDWQASFVDGAGGQSVTERMWQRMRPVTDGAITVTLKQAADAMRLIAEKSRTIAEGAGALSLAAAISDPSLEGPIVCVVSGGNIDLAKFAELVVPPDR
jgi:threonine dehydratase